MDKDVIYKTKCYSAIKIKIFPFFNIWMDPEDITLSRISQIEKDKHIMVSFTYGSKKQSK